MKKTTLDRLPMMAAVMLVVLIVGACAIHLRDDESQNRSAASFDHDPRATKLAECRSGTYEQGDALSECRKAWAEKRRQFLGQTPPTPPERAAAQGASPLFIPPEDGSGPRLGPPPHNSILESGKE